MPLPLGQHDHHRLAAPLASEMDLRAVPAATAAKCLGLPGPPFGSRRVLVRPDDGAVDEVQRPVQPSLRVGLPLQRGQDAIPDPGLLPAVEAATRPSSTSRSARARRARGCPVRKIQRMPLRTVRWSLAGRPVRGFCGGSRGRSRSHCASVRSLDFMPRSVGRQRVCGHALDLHDRSWQHRQSSRHPEGDPLRRR